MKHKFRDKARHSIFSCSIGFLFLMLLPTALFAQQEVRVAGVVTDNNQDPLIGVNVVLKGTTTGIATDSNGNYVLTVPSNGTLVFSLIGMLPQEISVNGRTTINITMEENVSLIDEVVVVGYGTVKKSDLTGAVGKVSV